MLPCQDTTSQTIHRLRVNGSSLRPYAQQMRHEATEAEARLWQCLRNRNVAGAKFRRQHALGRFVVDFACLESHLVIGVDGDIHDFRREYDAMRQQFLEEQGYRVLRFANDAVLRNLECVVGKIADAIA